MSQRKNETNQSILPGSCLLIGLVDYMTCLLVGLVRGFDGKRRGGGGVDGGGDMCLRKGREGGGMAAVVFVFAGKYYAYS